MPIPEAASIANAEAVTDMRERQDYWWTTVLTQSARSCVALQTKHPQLLNEDEWKTLRTRLLVAMQSTSRRTIRWACKKHKDFVLAAAVHKGHMEPRIARP